MKKIFALGDSVSIQYGKYLKDKNVKDFEYNTKTGEESGWDKIDPKKDKNGGDSSMVFNYLKFSQDFLKTDILLINCGLHDIRRNPITNKINIDIKSYEDNLNKIIGLCKNVSSLTIWITTTHVDDSVHNSNSLGFKRFEKDNNQYNQVAIRVMEENNISVIDLKSFTKNLNGDLFKDHIHFIEAVCQKQADFVFAELLKKFQRRPRPPATGFNLIFQHILM